MNDKILKLAEEVWGYDFKPNTPQFARVEAFYRAAYNKAIEDACGELHKHDDDFIAERAIRALEMK